MRNPLIEYIDNNRDIIIEPDVKLEKFRSYLKEAYPDVAKKEKPLVVRLDEYAPYYKPISPLRRVNYNPRQRGIPKKLPSLTKRKSPSVDELVDILNKLKK